MSSTILAVGAVLKKPLEDIYGLAKESTKEKIKRWRHSKHLQKIQRKLSAVERVKTIWQVDKAINLKEFYHPPKVLVDRNRTSVSRVRDLPLANIVVQGIAGQGKSIFLRFLCSQENVAGERLPLFVELRRLSSSETLLEFLVNTMKSYGFDEFDDEDFFAFAASGKLLLMLDGFDEIEIDLASKVISEIESLLDRSGDELQFVVTSRPDSGIERSTRFRVVRLAPLVPQDVPPILEKLCPDKDLRKNVLAAVEASSGQIKSLLTTPLMVTLLLLVYKTEQKIPDEFAAFYENLFWTLLVRHDRSKPGYIRRRRSKLSDSELKILFEAFCYLTRRNGFTKLSKAIALQTVDEACVLTSLTTKADEFLDDVVKVTCVLLEEGFDIYFIHRSVQEYFSASYISKRPDSAVVGFYGKLREQRRWAKWRQELIFLSQIDKYRYLREFYLPDAYDSLSDVGLSLPELNQEIDKEAVLTLLEDARFGIAGNAIVDFEDPYVAKQLTKSDLQSAMVDRCVFDLGISREVDIVNQFSDNPELESENPEVEHQTVLALDVVRSFGLMEEAFEAGRQYVNAILESVREAEKYVAREDGTASVLDVV